MLTTGAAWGWPALQSHNSALSRRSTYWVTVSRWVVSSTSPSIQAWLLGQLQAAKTNQASPGSEPGEKSAPHIDQDIQHFLSFRGRGIEALVMSVSQGHE